MINEVNEAMTKWLNTHSYLKNLSGLIKQRQGPSDPVALKLDKITEAIGDLGECDIIQMVLHQELSFNNLNEKS